MFCFVVVVFCFFGFFLELLLFFFRKSIKNSALYEIRCSFNSIHKTLYCIYSLVLLLSYFKTWFCLFCIFLIWYPNSKFKICTVLWSWDSGISWVLYFTFALQRLHPQPQHYAPTTGLDPSPLQEFSLLIRSRLLSAAPESRTFKALSWAMLNTFWNIINIFVSGWKDYSDFLKHFSNKQNVPFRAQRSSKSAAQVAFSELLRNKNK